MTEPNYFNLLPLEVWTHALSFNNLNEVVNFGWTCKSAMALTDYTRKHLAPKRLCEMLYHRELNQLKSKTGPCAFSKNSTEINVSRKILNSLDQLKKVLYDFGIYLPPHLHSIGEYEELLFYLTCRGVLAGGAAAYERCLFMDDSELGDLDIFILNNDVEALRECIKKLVDWWGLDKIRISSGESIVVCGAFQLILTQHQTVKELLDNFDLDYVTCGYYQGTWFVSEDCWKAHCTRQVTNHLPTSIPRYLKAERKGFEIPTKLKINHNLRERPLLYFTYKLFGSPRLHHNLINTTKFKPLHIKGGKCCGDRRITFKNPETDSKELAELEEMLVNPQERSDSKKDFNYLRFRSRIKELNLAKQLRRYGGIGKYSYFNGCSTEYFDSEKKRTKYGRKISEERRQKHNAGLPIGNYIITKRSPLEDQNAFTFYWDLSYLDIQLDIQPLIKDEKEVWIYARYYPRQTSIFFVLDRRYFLTTAEIV